MTIPKILHRIWRGGPMPAEFAAYGETWRELHPGWKYIDWLDGDELPEMPEVFARSRKIVPQDYLRFEADVMRLQLLWTFGGVYADCDIEPLRPLDELLVGVQCFASWSPHRGKNGQRLLTNMMLGATPGHPFIGKCLDALPDAIRCFKGRPLAQMVGPHHISRIYDLYPEGVTVFDERVFSPQQNRDRDRGLVPDLSEAYAWHKWATSRDRRK